MKFAYIFSGSDMRRRAFTLTEMAIVLGVIGSILGVVWVSASKANDKNKVQRATAQVMTIASGYQSMWSLKGIDIGVGASWTKATCLGVHNGVFPADMINSAVACDDVTPNVNTYPLSPWGRNSYVQVVTNQPLNMVNIAYNNLSQNACNALANAFYNSVTMNYQAINNGTATGGGNGDGWTSQELPPLAANTPWASTDIDAACGANNLNIVQIGVPAQ